jgi:aspartyl-tRNA(Asn)/glutamyl-tRNA(Gln) amidotransferase subunit B
VLKTASVLDNYPSYEVTIGIEVHVQLSTKSKIFCTCANEVVKEPNKNICPICTGQPGTLPVLNKQVVNAAILAGLANNCTITRRNLFARKHYFYPDLPKGYQITQSDTPICTEGHVTIRLEDGSKKDIRLIRIHMEEDAGKNIHSASGNESFVDLNRAGTPLLEMVSYPDISSAYEAKEYLRTLRATMLYLGVTSGNMEDGAFRADTNISVRKKGAAQLGTRAELKNINSFKFIGDAIEYEIERQIELLESGEKVHQETRLWDTKNKKTIMMRSKEEAADYRYFNDPDLPVVEIDDEWIELMRAQLPELPAQKHDRFMSLGLTSDEATIFIDDRTLASYFEQANKLNPSKLVVNWILRDVMGYLKEHKIELTNFLLTPEKLAMLVTLLEDGIINGPAAKEVFETVAQTGADPLAVVKEKGLEQMGSGDELEVIIKAVVDNNPAQAQQYREGKDKLFGFFVGQAMKDTKGKGDPKVIQDLLKKYLA